MHDDGRERRLQDCRSKCSWNYMQTIPHDVIRSCISTCCTRGVHGGEGRRVGAFGDAGWARDSVGLISHTYIPTWRGRRRHIQTLTQTLTLFTIRRNNRCALHCSRNYPVCFSQRPPKRRWDRVSRVRLLFFSRMPTLSWPPSNRKQQRRGQPVALRRTYTRCMYYTKTGYV